MPTSLTVRTPTLEIVAATRQPTVQDLLRHTSGLTYGDTSPNLRVREAYTKVGVNWLDVTAGADGVVQQRSYPSAHVGSSAQAGWEYVESLDLVGNAPRIAEEAAALLRADECPPGVTTVVLPEDNEPDLDDLPADVRKEMRFVPAGDPPHRDSPRVAAARRLELVRADREPPWDRTASGPTVDELRRVVASLEALGTVLRGMERRHDR